MNTASTGVGLGTLLGAQPAAEAAAPAAPGGTAFTSALAAAAAPQLFAASQEDLLEAPSEDVPSAAALAFLSGLLLPVTQAVAGEAQGVDAPTGAAPEAAGSSAQRQATLLALLGARTSQASTPGLAAEAQPGMQEGSGAFDLLQMAQQAALPDNATEADALLGTLAGARGADAAVRPGGDSSGMSSLLSAALTATSGGRESAPPAPAHAAVRSHVGSRGWGDELGSRLVMMSLRGQHEGSLSLSPEHLGPLEVRISVSQDRTDVWFGAQHADTRAALADALPRLRELFAASGLSLGQAGVSHDMPRQAARSANPSSAGRSAEVAEGPLASTPVAPATSGRGLALLDAWA